MDNLANTYEDEWANVVKGLYLSGAVKHLIHNDSNPHIDPVKRQQFRQFVNTSERRQQSELIEERGQKRPADWPRASAPLRFTPDQLATPKSRWTWVTMAKKADMVLSDQGTTSVAVKYGDTQLAIYHVPSRGYYATQQMYAFFSVSCFSVLTFLIGVLIVGHSSLTMELLVTHQAAIS